MKIAHVTTVGISLYGLLLNQMRSLREAGYEVVAISSPSSFAPAIEAAGVRHISVPITRNITPIADLISLWRLWRVMRRERFAIVHTHTPKAGLLGQLAARLAGVPLVINTVHGFYLYSGMHPVARRIYLLLERLAATCSDRILSQNAEDIETAIREGVCRREKITFLGNGIDLTQFNPGAISTEAVQKFRADLGLQPDAPVVGFVGRLAAKRKGFADFLAAAQRISAQVPDCQFLVVGESDRGKADAMEACVAGVRGIAERCVFAGQRDGSELPCFYKLMHVLVLPSIFEGLPRVVMEASAMGVPAVVTDVKGNREAVLHGCNGLLVPLGDVSALATAVVRVLTDGELAAQMGVKGRAIALERFDEQATFTSVKNEYRRLLAEKRPLFANLFGSNMTSAPTGRVSRSASSPPLLTRATAGVCGDSSPRSLQLRQREQLRGLSVAKRVFDLFVAAAALVIFAPLLATLGLVVRLAIGAPILFKQQRPGLHGGPFTIYKFRTMSNARDTTGRLLPDAERLGWFGKFLRSTSVDELPELINVLRGEMSIVGPRPLLMEYLPRYSAEQMRRHDVLPGITGLAQINGRNAASWPRKFELDVWYVDHRSMWLDLKIMAATVWKVLKRDGINQSDRVSSERFMGNADPAESRTGAHV